MPHTTLIEGGGGVLSMSGHINKIKNAVAAELDRAFKQRDANISAELMTTLISSLALVTTQHCRGDQQSTSNCLDAACNLLNEEAARLLPVAVFMKD